MYEWIERFGKIKEKHFWFRKQSKIFYSWGILKLIEYTYCKKYIDKGFVLKILFVILFVCFE